MARETVILSACRTPVGRYLGTLTNVPAVQLGALVIREAIKRAGVADTDIEVIMGNVLTAGLAEPGPPSRHSRGPATRDPGHHRQQGMRFQYAFRHARRSDHSLWDADVIVAGGMENMSAAPIWCRRPAAATAWGRRPGRRDDQGRHLVRSVTTHGHHGRERGRALQCGARRARRIGYHSQQLAKKN